MTREHASPQRESGRPGGGAGRVDETGHSGVYPVSAMDGAGAEAMLHDEPSWGQGARGAAGYAEHGDSEVMPLPPTFTAEAHPVADANDAADRS
jgi:hypothetical protein